MIFLKKKNRSHNGASLWKGCKPWCPTKLKDKSGIINVIPDWDKQCYHCFFIDRLCRLLSIFRPGQDAKLIVFFKINKKEYKKKIKKKKRINNVIIGFFFIDRLCRLISIFFFSLKNK